MGIYFENYPEQNFTLAIFHGQVVDDELDRHISELLKETYGRPGKVGLCVICESASASKLSHQAVLSAGKRMHQARFRQNGKLAIVARNTVGFGLARAYQLAAEVAGLDETRVLGGNDFDAAIQWIGVSEFSADIRYKVEQMEEIHITTGFTSNPQ
ncbi:MAG: hypothetical protein AUJ57_04375 [Zetaproteobacteria bacterium CG1_02_53_45]|nr:MAG: hypothetical protein AUJ57_04375 [Zetaproteobacteria bacterium CG1_02_53_45]